MKITRTFTAGHQEHGYSFFKSKNLILCEKKVRSISKLKSKKVCVTVSDKRFAGSKLLRVGVADLYLSGLRIYELSIRGRVIFLSRAVRAYLVRKFRNQIRAALQNGSRVAELKLYFKIEEVK